MTDSKFSSWLRQQQSRPFVRCEDAHKKVVVFELKVRMEFASQLRSLAVVGLSKALDSLRVNSKCMHDVGMLGNLRCIPVRFVKQDVVEQQVVAGWRRCA